MTQTINDLNAIFREQPPITINGQPIDRAVLRTSLPASKPIIRHRTNQLTSKVLQPRVISSTATRQPAAPPVEEVMLPVEESPYVEVVNDPPPTVTVPVQPPPQRIQSHNVSLTEDRKFVIPTQTGKDPVTLDLAKIKIPDYESMTVAERREQRSQLLLKLNIVSERNTGYTLPNFAEHPEISETDLFLYHQGFLTYMSVTGAISRNKIIWILGCLGIELLCVKMGFVSVKGFTNMQMKNSLETEMLLIQMGCQTITSNGVMQSDWPPVLQIIVSTVVSLLIFIVLRLILRHLGLDETMASMGTSTIYDYLSGRKELPSELLGNVVQGVTNNPNEPLSGILGQLSNVNWGELGPALGSLFQGMTGAPRGNSPPQRANMQMYTE